MKTIQTVAGIIAVLFSIQPLASWAANSTTNALAPGANDDIDLKKTITIENSRDGSQPKGGNPMCGAGG